MENRIHQLEQENRLLKEKLDEIQKISSKKTKKRKRLLKTIGGLIAGSRLKKSIYQVVDQYSTKREVTKEAISEFLTSFLKRIIRVGLFTMLFALLPTILLWWQNVLIKEQNKKIEIQNNLTEANRRSAQMFIMSDVLSDINSELSSGKKTLSSPLIGRIISLSRSMKPYRYIKNGKLIDKPISPERGQLLISLCRSNINPRFFSDEILQESDFTESELTDSNLFGADLSDIHLDNSNLENSDMVNINFSNAWLVSCNLKNVDFTDSNLSRTNLSGSDFSNAILTYTKLNGADVTDIKLDNAIVHRDDWINYINSELKLKGSNTIAENYKLEVIDQNSKQKEYRIVKR